jgi:hypothetical protein
MERVSPDASQIDPRPATMWDYHMTTSMEEWTAWRDHYAKEGRSFVVSQMEQAETARRPFVVPSQWPPGHIAKCKGCVPAPLSLAPAQTVQSVQTGEIDTSIPAFLEDGVMNVPLTQIDGKLPNLALKKPAQHYRQCGDAIHFAKRVERDMLEPGEPTSISPASVQSLAPQREASRRREQCSGVRSCCGKYSLADYGESGRSAVLAYDRDAIDLD